MKETLALKFRSPGVLRARLTGTLPYLATSISTVYLVGPENQLGQPTLSSSTPSWSRMRPRRNGCKLLSRDRSRLRRGPDLLPGRDPLGLEYAEKAPERNVLPSDKASASWRPPIAWPTMLLPMEWALTRRFLYPSLASVLRRRSGHGSGLGAAWYATYRFVLTGIVGVTIFLTLIARAKIDDKSPRITTGDIRRERRCSAKKRPYVNWSLLEAEEKRANCGEKEEKEKEAKKREGWRRRRLALRKAGKGIRPRRSASGENWAERGSPSKQSSSEENEEKADESGKDQDTTGEGKTRKMIGRQNGDNKNDSTGDDGAKRFEVREEEAEAEAGLGGRML